MLVITRATLTQMLADARIAALSCVENDPQALSRLEMAFVTIDAGLQR